MKKTLFLILILGLALISCDDATTAGGDLHAGGTISIPGVEGKTVIVGVFEEGADTTVMAPIAMVELVITENTASYDLPNAEEGIYDIYAVIDMDESSSFDEPVPGDMLAVSLAYEVGVDPDIDFVESDFTFIGNDSSETFCVSGAVIHSGDDVDGKDVIIFDEESELSYKTYMSDGKAYYSFGTVPGENSYNFTAIIDMDNTAEFEGGDYGDYMNVEEGVLEILDTNVTINFNKDTFLLVEK
ncbi:hypothetical protein EXM22_10975 [Oceanispirochaeta crateris]|uniref:DUF4382 domain-containing protein n=1 Tax=Oceanispirochaeta crateris TaxID=2518645 RepID=A0A5C1QK28_9SPIO|nr:hypothetical protein [Oceanispirochaeta crateris]QEN08483.1 hypothetical protein EXM22_10975 [Oceanispirochaeta crateris]